MAGGAVLTVTADMLRDGAEDAGAADAEAAAAQAGTFSLDLGLLAAFDAAPVDREALRADPAGHLLETARAGTERLVHALFSLPHVPSTEPGRVVQLPPPTTRLPRAKPLPQAKPPTKWEQFAKIKGIQKRKRSRMVWDETLQKYMPRWGFKRAGSVDQVWAVEHKGEGADDPWTREERERKERVAKNEKQRQRNILRAAGGDRVPGTLDLTSVRPAKRLKRGAAKDDGEDAAEMAALGKSAPAAAKASHHVDVALQVAQRSTASMGIFDGELRNEPKRKLPRDAPRATAPPVDVKSERQFSLKLLKRIVGGDEGDEVDLSRAVSRVQAEKETARRDAKVVAARAGATKRRGKQ